MAGMVPTPADSPVQVFAHRGDSGLHPEMTRAAFASAIEIARTRGVRLGLECDVHFTADGQLGCLHDKSLARTGRDADGNPVDQALDELTVAQLKEVDFGSWRTDLTDARELTAAEREFMTLADLLELVAQAREDGLDIGIAIETKHPVSRDDDVEAAVAALLRERGWTGADSGIRMITFRVDAVARMDELLPELPQSFLFSKEQVWQDLQSGDIEVKAHHALGVDGRLLLSNPGLVAEIRATGRECHVWTANESADIKALQALGVEAITSDFPDRVFDAVAG